MNNLTEFISMSGDGIFVWPCYIMTVLVLLANVLFSRARFKQLQMIAKRRSTQK